VLFWKTCRDLILARAITLHEANVAVEVFPLVKPEETFPMDFWNHVVHVGEDAESGTSYSDGIDTLYRLQVCLPSQRQRGVRQDSSHLPWTKASKTSYLGCGLGQSKVLALARMQLS
jgi:hypothetical protein